MMISANLWQRFTGLLPRGQRSTGIVQLDNGDGTSTVELRDGILQRVHGSADLLARVMIIDGAIAYTLPALPQSEQTITAPVQRGWGRRWSRHWGG